jgi:hypothetical protein
MQVRGILLVTVEKSSSAPTTDAGVFPGGTRAMEDPSMYEEVNNLWGSQENKSLPGAGVAILLS